MDPYRQVVSGDRDGAAPAELVCVAIDRERRGKPGVGVLQFFMLPATVGALLSAWVGPAAGLGGIVAAAVLVVWWWRRAHGSHDCVLRVEDGELSVRWRKASQVRTSLRLADLADVVLDTKAIQRLQDGANMIPGMRFIDSRVAPEVDVSRIVFVEADGTSTALGDRHLAHMDATEWLGKIRVFLRKHGWVPEDERDGE